MVSTRRLQIILKRLFDIVAASAGIVVVSPVILPVALAVRWFMGSPVIFGQQRIGKDGKVFRIYKLRTMTNDRDGNGQLLSDERRLTALGRFMRKTSLDEFPALINVVKGELSLVGPRPLLVDYRDLYTAKQWRRHSVPSGIAGPVTAAGRNAISWEQKFELDLWYVDNWSLWLDAKILFRTLWKAALREGVSAEGHATMPRFMGSSESPKDIAAGRNEKS